MTLASSSGGVIMAWSTYYRQQNIAAQIRSNKKAQYCA